MAKSYKIFLALLLALTTLLMAACSGEDGTAQTEPETDQPAATAASDGITLEKTVVYDAGGITVTATGYANALFGPEVTFLVENRSEQEVLVTTSFTAVNGCMMPYCNLSADVAAGEEATASITFLTEQLESVGIEQIAQLQFSLLVVEPESWETLATSERITLNTSAGINKQTWDDSGEVVYDEGGVRIVSQGLRQDTLWYGALLFCMENSSDRDISVHAEEVYINGCMVSTAMWTDVVGGTRAVDGMYLLDMNDTIVESIDEVESVAFTLRIVDVENQTDIAVTEQITLSFSEDAE